MMTEAEKRATKKYEEANIVRVCLKLNKRTDSDILEALAGSGNKQGFIKECIRNGIKMVSK